MLSLVVGNCAAQAAAPDHKCVPKDSGVRETDGIAEQRMQILAEGLKAGVTPPDEGRRRSRHSPGGYTRGVAVRATAFRRAGKAADQYFRYRPISLP